MAWSARSKDSAVGILRERRQWSGENGEGIGVATSYSCAWRGSAILRRAVSVGVSGLDAGDGRLFGRGFAVCEFGDEGGEEFRGGGAGGGELRFQLVHQGHQLIHFGHDPALFGERVKPETEPSGFAQEKCLPRFHSSAGSRQFTSEVLTVEKPVCEFGCNRSEKLSLPKTLIVNVEAAVIRNECRISQKAAASRSSE